MKPVTIITGFVLGLWLCTGCGQPPAAFKEKRVVIAPKETIQVHELNLSVTNEGCGRKWVSEEGKPAYEQAYCGLVIKYKDSTVHSSNSQPVYINDIVVRIDKMNPWGREEDSVPAGGCRVIISKVEGIIR
jgi:hypothetical protein